MRHSLTAVLLLASAAAAAAPPAGSSGYSGHGADSVSPEVLARFAPTPVAPEVSRVVQAALDLRAPSSGILSPDGKTLYFTWNVTGVNQVWRLDGPRQFPIQLTGGEDATTVADLTPDGKTLVLSRDRRGEENPGLYLQAATGGALREIQHKPRVQTILAFVSDDGRWVYFSANDIRPDAYALYRYEIASGTRELLFDQPGLWSIEDHQRNGRLLVAKSTGSLTREYFELDPSSKALTPLLGQGELEEYEALYSASPGELLVHTPKLGEYRRLYRYRPGGKLEPVTPELKSDVSAFTIDQARTRILYTVNDRGYTRLGALDAKRYTPLTLPEFRDADHVRFGSSTRDGRLSLMRVGTPKAPDRSYVYDWRTRKLTEWVTPSTPEIDTSRFVAASLESYPARDGTAIPMFVRRPARCGTTPCPVIVLFHGGPEGQSRPGFSPIVQLFVDAGFILIEPNVRGSDGYGKSWLHADDGPRRLDVITDIEDCARYVRRTFAVGGKAPKVGIYGGSYGGYSTLVGMSMFAGAYDAGVSVVGISNLLTFLKNTAPYRRILRQSEYGDPDKDAEALKKLSPVTYLDRVAAPLLIMQGASDPRVPVGEAVQFYDALAARKIPAELIIFADEGHGAQKRDNRVLQFGHVLAFFNNHLKGQ